MRHTLSRTVIRAFVAVLSAALRLAAWVGREQRPLRSEPLHVMLTGAFYSDNWLETHLRPLGRSPRVGRVTMVAVAPVPEMPGVEAVYASESLIRVLGKTAARLVTFARTAMRQKPDVVGGFHLLLNGLIGQLVARSIGCRSMYICGGGVREIAGGGYATENEIFRRLGRPSPYVERKLLAAALEFDYVITMGSSVRDYFVSRGASGRVEVVPGGFDPDVFYPATEEPEYDLVIVGRLSPVKRVDVFIDALARAGNMNLTGVVVGDGPSGPELRERALRRGVADRIHFAGWQTNVDAWLRKSRLFMLTSDSEGLSQAMVQAMMCGLPVIVSDVGDLKDLVVAGRNGYLFAPGDVDDCADKVSHVCADPELRALLGGQARLDSLRLSVSNVASRWSNIFSR
jgi:L-malate glycosyltransferase